MDLYPLMTYPKDSSTEYLHWAGVRGERRLVNIPYDPLGDGPPKKKRAKATELANRLQRT